MKNIAFIGLGHMGLPMAQNLLKAGHKVVGYDINLQALEAFHQQGGTTGKDIPSTVKHADVVITMLPEGKHVLRVYEGERGIFNHAKGDALIAECSTIDIATAQHIHQHAEEKGIRLIDSPVSGGVGGAQAANLTFMVGGKEEDFKALESILHLMGKNLIYCGEAGLGQAAKICNNLVLGITMIGVCEAFHLAEKVGLEAQKFFEVTSQSSAQSWSISNYCPVPGPVPSFPANRDYAAGFTAAMMMKDLKLAALASEMISIPSPLGSQALALYTLFCQNGGKDFDFSGIMMFLRGMRETRSKE